MLRKIAFLVILLVGLAVAASSFRTITFQGFLTDATGKAAFGTKYMGFKFFDAKTNGRNYFHEAGITPAYLTYRPVTVYNGNYAAKISFTKQQLVAILTTLEGTAAGDEEVWVEVYVSDTDPGTEAAFFVNAKKMSPRIQLTSSPFSFGAYWQ